MATATKRGAPVQLDYKQGSREQSGRAASKADAPVRLEYKNGSPDQSVRSGGNQKQPLHKQPGMQAPQYGAVTVRKDKYDPQGGSYIDWNDSHLSGKDRNAASAVISVLKAYGLESLAHDIVGFVKKGYDTQTILLELENTTAWEQRFAGNKQLQKKGLAPLSPADYLSTEQAYSQVLRQYGLPKGFMDSQHDFADLIGKGVSPSELQTRAQAYTSFVATKDQATVKALSQYGLGVGDLAAYYMNPGRALPLIQKKTQQIQVASAAIRQGVDVSKGTINGLVAQGVTADQAAQGFGQVEQYGADLENLGKIYGVDYTQHTAVNDFLLGRGEAAKKRQKLASQERATWSGSSNGAFGSGSQSQSF